MITAVALPEVMDPMYWLGDGGVPTLPVAGAALRALVRNRANAD